MIKEVPGNGETTGPGERPVGQRRVAETQLFTGQSQERRDVVPLVQPNSRESVHWGQHGVPANERPKPRPGRHRRSSASTSEASSGSPFTTKSASFSSLPMSRLVEGHEGLHEHRIAEEVVQRQRVLHLHPSKDEAWGLDGGAAGHVASIAIRGSNRS